MENSGNLRFGILGLMGPENGHPYSWSAIINGDCRLR